MTTENPTYHFAGFGYDYQTVEALKPAGLVALYNQLTGRATKKFSSRAKSVQLSRRTARPRGRSPRF